MGVHRLSPRRATPRRLSRFNRLMRRRARRIAVWGNLQVHHRRMPCHAVNDHSAQFSEDFVALTTSRWHTVSFHSHTSLHKSIEPPSRGRTLAPWAPGIQQRTMTCRSDKTAHKPEPLSGRHANPQSVLDGSVAYAARNCWGLHT